MYSTLIISFNEEQSNSMVYSPKKKGEFLVQSLNPIDEDKVIPTNDATLDNLKSLVHSYITEGYQVVSLFNAGMRGTGSGLSLNSTITMSKKV